MRESARDVERAGRAVLAFARMTRTSWKLVLLLGALTLLGVGCVRPAGPRSRAPLAVWGVFDDADTMQPLLRGYENEQRGARVEYKKVSPVDSYEQQLLRSLAENRGPDVFLIHTSWIPRWQGALLPAPADVMPARAVQEEFVDTVAKDLVVGDRVLALPLFVDTLALYYNKDLLNSAGVARPPKTWQEVHEVVKRVTTFNEEEPGQIDRHGIALGAGKNVNRAPDVLSLLMIQNGAKMVDENGLPAFGSDESALQALTFYTDFANSSKDIYTWNLRSDYSLDAFAEGEAAMMVNYAYHRPTIQAKNPRLNFGIAPLPQVEIGNPDNPPKTYAGYWAYAVSRQTLVPDEAWAFVRSITRTEPSRQYLAASGYPPARRDLVAALQNDSRIGVFAKQALIATTWRQPDNRVVDRVFTEAIDAVVSGQDTVEGSLRRAAEQITAAATALQGGAARTGLDGGAL